MSESLILHCPSKLNLTLEVLKKKDNGMHEIKSHFQLIDLCDVMHIEKSNAQQSSIRTNASIDIDSKKNLAYQAIEAVSKHVSQELHCNIIIEKNIPIGGGLGGGSSNAAAALIGINQIFSLQIIGGYSTMTSSPMFRYPTMPLLFRRLQITPTLLPT